GRSSLVAERSTRTCAQPRFLRDPQSPSGVAPAVEPRSSPRDPSVIRSRARPRRRSGTSASPSFFEPKSSGRLGSLSRGAYASRWGGWLGKLRAWDRLNEPPPSQGLSPWGWTFACREDLFVCG